MASRTQLGYPAHVMLRIGLIEVALLVPYALSRTSILGAIPWTGYLGGAIATRVRVENPLFSHAIFPIYVAAPIWGALVAPRSSGQSPRPLTDFG